MYNFSGEWGLVLAGGGGKGSFQIGAFKAIKELIPNIKIVGVAGTSVGALNTALFALNDQELAEEVWSNISPEMFLDTELDMFDFKEGIFLRDGLLELIDQYVNLEKISKCNIPLYCTTSKYTSETDKHAMYHLINDMSNDRIKQVLLASSAIPFVYEPVMIDGYMHKDGGLCDNRPVYPLYNLGIRQFIVISMDTDSEITDIAEFPDAKFLHIRPGRSIGQLIDGTLDFTSKNAKIRMKQGYLDARRDINAYNGEKLYQDSPELSAQEIMDYKQLEFEIQMESTQSTVDNHMNDLDNLLKKYNI